MWSRALHTNHHSKLTAEVRIPAHTICRLSSSVACLPEMKQTSPCFGYTENQKFKNKLGQVGKHYNELLQNICGDSNLQCQESIICNNNVFS